MQTVTHETFQRVQLQICPIDPSRKTNEVRQFDDLTFYNFPDQKDQEFYKIIAHVFLEGTATFVGGIEQAGDVDQGIEKGKELLDQCIQAIYTNNDLEKAEKLLNQGLISNGPFYSLGYHMSKTIVNKTNEKQLGRIISQGCLTFFNKFMEISTSDQNNKQSFFSATIINKLTDMNSKL